LQNRLLAQVKSSRSINRFLILHGRPSSSDEVIKVALGLVDETDEAARKMVAECETLLQAVRQATDQIRSELREKMIEFATVMRDYSETIAAKNMAYVESTRNTIDVVSSHIETVRAAMKAVAPERV
jgi:3-oxoacyl-(acyl-carrier-protein) synthase